MSLIISNLSISDLTRSAFSRPGQPNTIVPLECGFATLGTHRKISTIWTTRHSQLNVSLCLGSPWHPWPWSGWTNLNKSGTLCFLSQGNFSQETSRDSPSQFGRVNSSLFSPFFWSQVSLALPGFGQDPDQFYAMPRDWWILDNSCKTGKKKHGQNIKHHKTSNINWFPSDSIWFIFDYQIRSLHIVSLFCLFAFVFTLLLLLALGLFTWSMGPHPFPSHANHANGLFSVAPESYRSFALSLSVPCSLRNPLAPRASVFSTGGSDVSSSIQQCEHETLHHIFSNQTRPNDRKI